EAGVDLARAHAMGGNEPWVAAYYGWVLSETGDDEKARAVLREAIIAAPDDSEAPRVLAQMEYERGRQDEALRHVDAAIACSDGSAKYHVLRSVVLLALGRESD